MGAWTCWPEHKWSSRISWTFFDVVWTMVRFWINRWFWGCFRPIWHWSNFAGRVHWRLSWTSGCFHNPEPAGFSIWQCRLFSRWIFISRLHKRRCGLDSSWLWWILSHCWMLRFWLKRFHAHHGKHSGASQRCFGEYSKTMRSNFTLPANVLRSPSCFVNRRLFPPRSWTALVRCEASLAYTSKRSMGAFGLRSFKLAFNSCSSQGLETKDARSKWQKS